MSTTIELHQKYHIAIVAMFKNEAWIIKSWIQHYLRQGINHFYLIDNGSQDDYQNEIVEFMDKITLIIDPTHYPIQTQFRLINQHFQSMVINQVKWVLVCDIDEYVYARNQFNQIGQVLDNLDLQINHVFLPWKTFGSNSYIRQPLNIIQSFTRRERHTHFRGLGYGKSITRVNPSLQLGVHLSYLELSIPFESDPSLNSISLHNIYNANGELINLSIMDSIELNLHCNHYMMMSQDYYQQIKCQRGGQSGFCSKYTMTFFDISEIKYNEVVDDELKCQIDPNIKN